MSTDTADALLAHAQRTVEEDTAIERVHGLLLEERLEEEHKWLGKIMEWFEEDGPPLERREEELDSDCPLQWRPNKTQSEVFHILLKNNPAK